MLTAGQETNVLETRNAVNNTGGGFFNSLVGGLGTLATAVAPIYGLQLQGKLLSNQAATESANAQANLATAQAKLAAEQAKLAGGGSALPSWAPSWLKPWHLWAGGGLLVLIALWLFIGGRRR